MSIDADGPTVNIEISLFGIRNLIRKAKKPIITFRLTNDPEKREHIVKPDQALDTCNPNIGKIVLFKGVKMKKEPLLWP